MTSPISFFGNFYPYYFPLIYIGINNSKSRRFLAKLFLHIAKNKKNAVTGAFCLSIHFLFLL
ncbi:hypothetical protein HMPREF0083_04401 [Aneurinibacillus aneurinilyticus ATCC 12856]|uniref:Uncharacterized protein n=1 Tax=Aneurinibacillus aneurinilyticus ATCC 12856 TaxID=649747 RepID=U1WG27_ANEAE|nr:hypothetical protein HMPREF0083_04401 [Aneurinibacillus aneurinilyticus ATCC 12856]